MPYAIEKTDGSYRVKNTETGRVAAKGTTKTKAERQERLLRGVEHGMKPNGRKAKDPPGDFHHETVILSNPHLVEYYYDNLRRM